MYIFFCELQKGNFFFLFLASTSGSFSWVESKKELVNQENLRATIYMLA